MCATSGLKEEEKKGEKSERKKKQASEQNRSRSTTNSGENCTVRVCSYSQGKTKQCFFNAMFQVQCCFTSTETIRTIRDVEPRTSVSSSTQLRSSVCFSCKVLFKAECSYGIHKMPDSADIKRQRLAALSIFSYFEKKKEKRCVC